MATTIEGKRILLTGASSGIGSELARELAERGAVLAIAARRVARLARVADEIELAGHRRPICIGADLSKRGSANDVVGRALHELGAIDVLVNNAAGSVQGLTASVGDRDEGRELFETNFWAPLALTQALAPSMRMRGSGTIVNVTSLVQVAPFPGLGHYGASKAALGLATETLRLELRGTGVHVLEVALGPVDTPHSAESRLLPGGDELVAHPRLTSPEVAARAIAKAIERERDRLVYPRRLGLGYLIPALGRRCSRRRARDADLSGLRVRRGGSMGDEASRSARAAWEQAHERPRDASPA